MNPNDDSQSTNSDMALEAFSSSGDEVQLNVGNEEGKLEVISHT